MFKLNQKGKRMKRKIRDEKQKTKKGSQVKTSYSISAKLLQRINSVLTAGRITAESTHFLYTTFCKRERLPLGSYRICFYFKPVDIDSIIQRLGIEVLKESAYWIHYTLR